MLLQDMYDNYWSHGTDWDISGRSNSGGSIKLYGHQRKVQEQMVKGNTFFRIELKLCYLERFQINHTFLRQKTTYYFGTSWGEGEYICVLKRYLDHL